MKFREHRGTLADSMATMVELEPTKTALVLHLQSILAGWPSAPMPMHFNTNVQWYYGEDPRIDWKATYIVTILRYGVIGFTDEPLPLEAGETADSLGYISASGRSGP